MCCIFIFNIFNIYGEFFISKKNGGISLNKVDARSAKVLLLFLEFKGFYIFYIL